MSFILFIGFVYKMLFRDEFLKVKKTGLLWIIMIKILKTEY